MVASIGSFGGLALAQGLATHAVASVAVAPALSDPPRPSGAPSSASLVALAPAAMTALIEAQERLSHDAPWVVRQDTAQKIDQLIGRLGDPPPPAETHADLSFAMRRLIAARQALSESLVDLRA